MRCDQFFSIIWLQALIIGLVATDHTNRAQGTGPKATGFNDAHPVCQTMGAERGYKGILEGVSPRCDATAAGTEQDGFMLPGSTMLRAVGTGLRADLFQVTGGLDAFNIHTSSPSCCSASRYC